MNNHNFKKIIFFILLITVSNQQASWNDFVNNSYDKISKLSANQKVMVGLAAGAVALGAWFYNRPSASCISSAIVVPSVVNSDSKSLVLETNLIQNSNDCFNYKKISAIVSVGLLAAAAGCWLYRKFFISDNVNISSVSNGSVRTDIAVNNPVNNLSTEENNSSFENITINENNQQPESSIFFTDAELAYNDSDLDDLDSPIDVSTENNSSAVVVEEIYDDFTSIYNESIYSGSDYRNQFDSEEHTNKLKFEKITEKNKRKFNWQKSICHENGEICFLNNGIKGQLGSVLVKKPVKMIVKGDNKSFFNLYNFDGTNEHLLFNAQIIKLYRFDNHIIALGLIGKKIIIKKLQIRSALRINQIGRDFVINLNGKSGLYGVQLDAISFMDKEGQEITKINYIF